MYSSWYNVNTMSNHDIGKAVHIWEQLAEPSNLQVTLR